MTHTQLPETLRFFKTHNAPCNYLENKQSSNLLVDPDFTPSTQTVNTLLNMGFRRSGSTMYRPNCDECNACVATRIPVADFTANRNQHRCSKTNQNLTIEIMDAGFDQASFDLYTTYLKTRHPGGGMDQPNPDHFSDFLFTKWSNTRFIKFKLKAKLIAVASTDFLPEGLSAVYTWFDPSYAKHSLGTYSILQQIYIAQEMQLPYVYLGYWIESCDKMNYKTRFQKIEGYINNEWQLL